MTDDDPTQKGELDVANPNRRRILKISALGAVGALGTGNAAARRGPPDDTPGGPPQDECTCEDMWAKYDFDSGDCEFYFSDGDGDDIEIIGFESKDGEDCEPVEVDYRTAGYGDWTITKICAFGGRDHTYDDDPEPYSGTFNVESELKTPSGQQAAISNLTFCYEEKS